jgi:Protein of unknown function (DUF2970)
MSPESGNTRPEPPSGAKKASLLQTVWIVVSGLFMIGRKRDFGPAAPKIDPVLLVIVALVGAVLLIASLVMLATSIAH